MESLGGEHLDQLRPLGALTPLSDLGGSLAYAPASGEVAAKEVDGFLGEAHGVTGPSLGHDSTAKVLTKSPLERNG